MKTRRDVMSLLAGGAAVAWPLAARAQQGERMRRMGVLMATADDREGQARVLALKQGLQELGWTDGRNIQIETRFGGPTPTAKLLQMHFRKVTTPRCLYRCCEHWR